MAINITHPEDQPDKTVITLDNGHAASLKKIVKDYDFKGESEALSFMLAVLDTASGGKIEIGGASYVPSDILKNSPKIQSDGDN